MEKIVTEAVGKRFGPHLIFEEISFEIARGGSVCLWGPNGSGKSTLLKIMAGLIRASSGNVTYFAGGKSGKPGQFKNLFGMSAPDVRLYDELSPLENLEFLRRSRGLSEDTKYESELLEQFSLTEFAKEPIENFSSGMRQKFHLIGALAHRPAALLLDEPTSFMDEAGRRQTAEIIAGLKPASLLAVATNDPAERAWCEATIELRK
ncbi:MAG: ABC transporter ATP-binding protein [bacterium]